MDAQDFIVGEAELDVEEELSEQGDGEPKQKANGMHGNVDDSSDEDEDDDDEEAARAVREGFIVDEDEEEEEEPDRASRRRRDKKRRREERAREEEGLDEEDLDLIGEANPEFERTLPSKPKFKRLKRGHRDVEERGLSRGLEDIFSDDDEGDAHLDARNDRLGRFRPDAAHAADEFDDFIEEDKLTDDEEQDLLDDEEREVARPRGPRGERAPFDPTQLAGMDGDGVRAIVDAFGDGTDYDWALKLQDEMDDLLEAPQNVQLTDVYEFSQVAEKLLTEEDNVIRLSDEPERFQLARKPFRHVVLTDEQLKEEAIWVSRMMPKRNLPESLREPFLKAVAKVLEFFITDEVEVPFVFQHRKDYLIHAAKVPVTPDPANPNAPEYVVSAEKLLNQNDLWQILEYDLKFRALIDKRNSLQRTYDKLQKASHITDKLFESMLPAAETMEELQDLQDYLYFQHASHVKDLKLLNGESETAHRRAGVHKSLYERIRSGKLYSLVRAFGITADAFAQNALREGRRQYTEDPSVRPDDMADSEDVLDAEFSTGVQALRAAKMMFAEEIAHSPKMRKVMRRAYYMSGIVESFRTDKGLKKIDEQHPYYEIKYLRNQQLSDIARRPDMYLKMLKAEEEGLVEVRIRLENEEQFKKQLFNVLASDNFSEIADAWNAERKDALNRALIKMTPPMARSVKENLRQRCEDEIAAACREEFSKRLDQAPYQPGGMVIGTVPRVLALSFGAGVPGRDAVCWAWLEEDGRVLETGKFKDLRYDEEAKNYFIELVQRRKPDVLGVSGFTVETRKLVADLEKIIDDADLRVIEYEDPDTGEEQSKRLEVVMVNDEVARLYHTSDRAASERPMRPPLTRYCIALARYLQDPLKEYVSLGRDIISISFHPSQQLVPQEKIVKQLESAMVDMVDLCGVDLGKATSNPYHANLLKYVCGLGPRKAIHFMKTIHATGGQLSSRAELLGDIHSKRQPIVGPRVWNNLASFIYLEYDDQDNVSEYLDNTRVHPEDYDLGRKMAADALELDEEDIKMEIEESGPGAVVRKLIKEDAQEKVNDLILEEYAEQLEHKFNQRKRATLETIRAELQQPYEELRRNFSLLTTDEIFTMLTGETRESLCVGMVVPVSIKRVLTAQRQLEVRLDCGVTGIIEEHEISDRLNYDLPLTHFFSPHQTLQAKILSLSRSNFEATFSIREEILKQPYRKQYDRMRDEWDDVQEEKDRELLKEKNNDTGRTQRVIKHPLFRPFNSAQAEEFLGSQGRGDAVIRPSSKGLDHIAITWKVSDNVYQHIDVLELNKENEFSVGRILKIGGKYTYSDLDELIVNHIKAMARKVDEMTLHEKFQGGSKTETERWLTTYTEANPKRSVYAFCINPKHPGYFSLCFKAGQKAHLGSWPVKVIPNAYELRGVAYPDMRALCNGFKMIFSNMHGAGGR
ncbi:MAG: hypothetical protein M1823_004365 [Watsoniomyces obsoletus]|nr:MAG: hypothetical protein M1823_004365 [Watsoniomyces obsoletus]